MTSIGDIAEQIACDYLLEKKLTLVTKNYHSRRGEIDLIMLDQHTLVFVEVRYRKSSKFGSALESVTLQKQQKIIFTAEHFIANQNNSYKQFRFDVIAISPDKNAKPEVNWIQNAFQLN
jgi:putative endonuclease